MSAEGRRRSGFGLGLGQQNTAGGNGSIFIEKFRPYSKSNASQDVWNSWFWAATSGIVATGIPSAEAFGSPTIGATVSTTGITSAEALGSPVVGAGVTTTGIATGEALGSPSVSAGVSAAGVASAEAFGSQAVAASISATGIASAEAFGLPDVGGTTGISGAGGIASAEAFGTPDVSAAVTTTGIASAEALGSPVVSAGISSTGIASAEALGAPAVSASVVAAGIASAEALGSPAVAAAISATGIASAEAFGQPTVGSTGISGAGGIASAEAFGSPSIAAGITARSIAASLSAQHAVWLECLARLHGLIDPLIVSSTMRSDGTLVQTLSGDDSLAHVATTAAPVGASGDSALTALQAQWLEQLVRLYGVIDPLTITPSQMSDGTVTQTITRAGNSTTVTKV